MRMWIAIKTYPARPLRCAQRSVSSVKHIKEHKTTALPEGVYCLCGDPQDMNIKSDQIVPLLKTWEWFPTAPRIESQIFTTSPQSLWVSSSCSLHVHPRHTSFFNSSNGQSSFWPQALSTCCFFFLEPFSSHYSPFKSVAYPESSRETKPIIYIHI